jgi:hypothetical protein
MPIRSSRPWARHRRCQISRPESRSAEHPYCRVDFESCSYVMKRSKRSDQLVCTTVAKMAVYEESPEAQGTGATNRTRGTGSKQGIYRLPECKQLTSGTAHIVLRSSTSPCDSTLLHAAPVICPRFSCKGSAVRTNLASMQVNCISTGLHGDSTVSQFRLFG